MRVKSESEWQQFCAEVAADPHVIAEPFRDFLVAWAENAEELMDHVVIDPIDALRDTLRGTEEQLGRWTVGFLGQMLVVLSTHWASAGEPSAFFDALTVIEQNLFADVSQLKMEQLVKAAADATPDGGER